jgi:hypothetical protein
MVTVLPTIIFTLYVVSDMTSPGMFIVEQIIVGNYKIGEEHWLMACVGTEQKGEERRRGSL